MTKVKTLFFKKFIVLIITLVVGVTSISVKATSNDGYTSLYYYSNSFNSY
ncbi:MAG: hypothetical protein HUJ68_00005, partial [Clostridia bacterium]|nr:hypothetical protein [Clostridia bacterium]